MTQPNILFISTDQHHYTALGMVNPQVHTPNLDRLAAAGTRFDRAYCPNPTCSPTRASLITGLYPSSHGCWAIGVKLAEDVPTVGDVFQANGYDATLIGKAHFQPLASAPGSESIERQPLLRDLDFWRDFQGPWYGFNHIETGRMHANESHAGQHYALWMEEQGLANWRDYFVDWPHRADDKYAGPWYMRDALTWDLPAEFHHTRWVAERSIANMQRCVDEGTPFFQWASFFDPHPPYVLPEPWASMYDPETLDLPSHTPGEFEGMPPHFARTQETDPDFSDYREPGGQGVHGFHSHLHSEAEMRRSLACYYGMISFIDQEIGRMLDYLDESGLAENTLIVFTTDHGHFLGQHGLIAKGPFHYEDVIRVPMIVRWPGHVPAGEVSQSLQSLVDYPQSFLAAAGIDAPGAMQGVNQLPVWTGESESAREWALVENRHNPTTVDLRTLVTERYKVTVYRDAPYGELFDLQDDPGEIRNRWDDPAYAAVKSDLLLKFVQAEIQREGTRMPRIAGA